MTVKSREIRLKSRPKGMPAAENFELAVTDLPDPADGEILVRNVWMSVDPYMRGRMTDRKSYIPPFQLGKAMEGGAVGEVIASNNPAFSVGDYVVGFDGGWKEYYLSSGRGLMKVDPAMAPLSAYLGVLGMPGMTAYVGLMRIGELKEGETVLVSAAAGAVGSIACQIARARGCRVIGIAGGEGKCAWLKSELGVDETVDYKAAADFQALQEAFDKACSDGVDVYFENVGGDLLTAALNVMKPFGRIVMCGLISVYNAETPQPGPWNLFHVVAKRLKMQGFIVSDHNDVLPQFTADMAGWMKEGRIKYKETVHEGIEKAPEAFLGLFSGANTGKMLVRLGPDRRE